MKECIELEHSDEYQRGYADGIESFRAIFNEFNATKTCEGCINEFVQRDSCGDCEICIRSMKYDNYEPKVQV
jgi:hypothetical protein